MLPMQAMMNQSVLRGNQEYAAVPPGVWAVGQGAGLQLDRTSVVKRMTTYNALND